LLIDKAIQEWHPVAGDMGANLAIPLNIRSMILVKTKRKSEAAATARAVLELIAMPEGVSGPLRPQLLASAAAVLSLSDLPKEAAIPSRQAVELAWKQLRSDDPSLGRIYSIYARILRQLKRKAEARDYEERAKRIDGVTADKSIRHVVDISELKKRHGPADRPLARK
jgi:hypothetical protein